MKNKTFLSVKKAEKLYGKMPAFIPEVLDVKPGEELEIAQVQSRIERIAKEGAVK